MSLRVLSRALLFALACLVISIPGDAQEKAPASGKEGAPVVRSAEATIMELQGDNLQARRNAAIRVWLGGRELQLQALPVMVDLLAKEKDGQVRLALLDAVTELGPAAEPAVEALVQSFRANLGGNGNEKRHQDYRVALALAAIGKPAVEGLRNILAERRENIRAEAAMALGRIGPDAEAAIGDLIKMLGEETERIQGEAALALGRIGMVAIEPLTVAAKDESALIRAGAITSLGMLSMPDERVGVAVLEGTRDSSPKVRAAAVRSLAALKFPSDTLLSALNENIRHDEEIVRVAVVNVLVEQPSLLEQFAPELTTLLSSDKEGVSRHAAYLLQRIGAPAAPALLDALKRDETRIEQVADALARIGKPVVGVLTDATQDPNARVRQGAALALGRILPVAPRTVEKLTATLEDSNSDVQEAVLDSIGRLGRRASTSVSAVRAKLLDEEVDTRLKAIDVLLKSAPRDGKVLDDFLSMLNDKDVRVQRHAIDTIRQLGPLGRRAVPVVINKLKEPDPEVRLAAANLIGSHGRAAADAVPLLTELLNDPNTELRAISAQTLGKLGTAAQPALPKLIPLLDDADGSVRAAVALTLGSLDMEPEEVRAHLAKALEDKESDVRRAAMTGVQRFGRRGTLFLPDLIRVAAYEVDRREVAATVRRFERSGPDAQSIPELIALLQHEQEAVRLLAIQFLGLAAQSAKEAIEPLEKLNEDSSAEVRKQALASIELIKNPSAAKGRRRGGKN